MSDTVHIAREKHRGTSVEALCGATGSKDSAPECGPPNKATCWKCITLRCGRPVPPEPPTPEHNRLKAAKSGRDQTQLVGEFLEWLGSEGIVLARWDENDTDLLRQIYGESRKLLAKFFEIDEGALESEKRALLDHLRAVTKASEWARTEGQKALRGK